ncbi:hypothetical protein ACHAXS_004633 [Conticribra weissflogii]
MFAMNAGYASASITSHVRPFWRRNHANLASCLRQQRPTTCSFFGPTSSPVAASPSAHLPFAWREARSKSEWRRRKTYFSTISHGHAGDNRTKISGKEQSTAAENGGGTNLRSSNNGHNIGNNDGNNDGNGQTTQSEKSQTTVDKLKTLFQKYGYTFVGTYLSIYFATLFTFFLALDSGLVNPEMVSDLFQSTKEIACDTATAMGPTGNDYGTSMNDAADAYAQGVSSEITQEKRTAADFVSSILAKWEWTAKHADKVERNPHLANLVVAWVVVKFTEPMRLGLAVWVVPKVARALGRRKGLEALGKKKGAQVGKDAVGKVE